MRSLADVAKDVDSGSEDDEGNEYYAGGEKRYVAYCHKQIGLTHISHSFWYPALQWSSRQGRSKEQGNQQQGCCLHLQQWGVVNVDMLKRHVLFRMAGQKSTTSLKGQELWVLRKAVLQTCNNQAAQVDRMQSCKLGRDSAVQAR